MQQFYNVAIIGSQSELSQPLLSELEQREFPLAQLFPINPDGEDDDGEQPTHLKWQGQPVASVDPQLLNWSELSIAWLLSKQELALDIAEQARQMGCVIIDMVDAKPEAMAWVHAEINPQRIAEGLSERWLCCASSLAGQLSLLLHIIQQDVALERVEVNALLSAAHKGKAGVDELAGQTARLLNGLPVETKLFPQQLAFNLLPEQGSPDLQGSSEFEFELSQQCRYLLQAPELNINVSAMQVPVFYGDSLSVHLYASYYLDSLTVREYLEQHPAFELIEDEQVTPVSHIANSDSVIVSRLRQNPSDERALNLCLMANNPLVGLVKSAAQIGETLIKQYI